MFSLRLSKDNLYCILYAEYYIVYAEKVPKV